MNIFKKIKHFFLKEEIKRIDALYYVVVALARLQYIAPEVLSSKTNEYDANRNYMESVKISNKILGKKKTK
jgi:hypothetical protein